MAKTAAVRQLLQCSQESSPVVIQLKKDIEQAKQERRNLRPLHSRVEMRSSKLQQLRDQRQHVEA